MNTYWNNSGKYQAIADRLQELIPAQGEIKGSKNKHLERYRKAVNAYYDLYNNGLCNRAQSFSKLFKMRPNEYRYGRFNQIDFKLIEPEVEPKMDAFVMEAAQEQFKEDEVQWLTIK